jgi:hypothetical protein
MILIHHSLGDTLLKQIFAKCLYHYIYIETIHEYIYHHWWIYLCHESYLHHLFFVPQTIFLWKNETAFDIIPTILSSFWSERSEGNIQTVYFSCSISLNSIPFDETYLVSIRLFFQPYLLQYFDDLAIFL